MPKQIRDRFHLVAGTSLELNVESDKIELRPLDREPAVLEKYGVLIHHGPESMDLDMAEFVNRERANRDAQLVREDPTE